jgi:CheY-like chemotaxis protein
MTITINCLFLDDDENRHAAFEKAVEIFQHINRDKAIKLNVTHVQGYFEACSALRKEQFDVVFLDHDLDDCNSHADFEESGYSKYYYTGADVAHFLTRELFEQHVRQLSVM